MTQLKIGEFAKLAQISTHRLRRYDKRGLLHPIHIDQQSGYRYYSVDQLGQVNRIIALQGLGFSLAAIKAALKANTTIDQMEEMLLQRQKEIEQEIAVQKKQLKQVHNRLQQIKKASQTSPYEIVIKSIPACNIASIRMIVASRIDASYYCHVLHREIHEVVAKLGLVAEPPAINLYHMTAYDETDIDLEACVVVKDNSLATTTTNSRVQFRHLKAYPKALTLLFSGDYGQLKSAIEFMKQWEKREGYRAVGAFREVHHSQMVNDVKSQDGKPVVELQIPVEKIS